MRQRRILIHLSIVALAASACTPATRLPVSAGIGPRPLLPAPRHSPVPTVNVVTAKGWPEDASPVAASGLSVRAFARGLDHPRWVYVLPNGDVLVAETNAPYRPEDAKGIRGFFFKYFQGKAGGAVPSRNRILLLRDRNGDGVADTSSVFVSGLRSPFGMALIGNTLYVANTDAVVRFPYVAGAMRIDAAPTKVVALPAGRVNHHWTKNLIASADGSKLYVAVGSNSNVAENGIAKETERAALLEVDVASGRHRVFASGLRNPVGLAWEPVRQKLWVAVNERDELGNDLVPDYITSVVDGGFYGWPYSYYGAHVDTRVVPSRPDLVARAISPEYALGSHTASLGLAWGGPARALPAEYQSGMFVGQHGSWNRIPRSGYKVIFVPFAGGIPSGPPVDVLSGFVTEKGYAMGRPVGVAIDRAGALLVADDVGNAIWRVTARTIPPAAAGLAEQLQLNEVGGARGKGRSYQVKPH